MSIVPIITFKAGRCEIDTSSRPHKVKALPEPGYIFLYNEDDLTYFCWRPRNVPIDQAPLSLVMIPGDGRFEPYDAAATGHPGAKTNGRIFVLKFTSSSQRYLFWLQSKPQSPDGDASWLSPRDRKIGELVDRLLQGDTPDINAELAQVNNGSGGGGGGSGGSGGGSRDNAGDDDETMEDAEGQGDGHGSHGGGAAGGAGAGATGGDVRSEGSGARDGGADGARAASSSAPDASEVVRNLLASLSGQPGLASGSTSTAGNAADKLFPMLNDLLETSVTVPVVRSASEAYIDGLLDYLPPTLVILSQQEINVDINNDDDDDDDDSSDSNNSNRNRNRNAFYDGDTIEPTADAVAAAKASMTLADKKALLEKVLRSPQFAQSLASLSTALRDGGLPSVAEALGIPVRHGGYLAGGAMPMGGGEAVEAFVEGVKTAVQKKREQS